MIDPNLVVGSLIRLSQILGPNAVATTVALDLSDWKVLASYLARNVYRADAQYRTNDDSFKVAGIRVIPALGRLQRGA